MATSDNSAGAFSQGETKLVDNLQPSESERLWQNGWAMSQLVSLPFVGKPMRDFLRIQALVFCGFLGGLAGAALSAATLGKWALERYRTEHPERYVCGMFLYPYLFLGFLVGAAVGVMVGWRVQRVLAEH